MSDLSDNKSTGCGCILMAIIALSFPLIIPMVLIPKFARKKGEYDRYDHDDSVRKTTSLLFCLFTGIFGGHKFYEGKVGMGVLYDLTLGLCGFGVVADLVRLLFRRGKYYDPLEKLEPQRSAWATLTMIAFLLVYVNIILLCILRAL